MHVVIYGTLYCSSKRSSESIALAQKKIDERESPDFGSDIDPLILACHLDNYEIVDLMVKRGHQIERPHPPNCKFKLMIHVTVVFSLVTVSHYSKLVIVIPLG